MRNLWLSLILAVVCTVIFSPVLSAWWDSSYSYRKNITNETSSDIGMAINGTNGFGSNIIV